MEGDGLGLSIALVALILLSAYFSATETAFTCVSKIKLKNLVNQGNKKAETVLNITENYDKLLSTILIGNNIVNITSASLATILFTIYFPKNGVTISTVVMTIVVLIFGEISPKTIAKQYPEKFALSTVGVLKLFVLILTPLNFIFSMWKKAFDKMFKKEEGPSITEEELKTIIEEVESEGVIKKHEGDLIRSAIEFDDLNVEDIIIPRIEIVGREENSTIDEIKEAFVNNGFSRLPVYRDSVDHIVGVIHEKDFFKLIYKGVEDIKEIIKTVLYITPNKKISTLLKELQQSKLHMAIVVDEYGGTEGLVTLEDILEELVGDIWDEHDEVLSFFKKIDDKNFVISCNAGIEEMFEFIGLEDDDHSEDVLTVNGWVVKHFDKIPEVGESIEANGMKITVTNAELKRVNEITIEIL